MPSVSSRAAVLLLIFCGLAPLSLRAAGPIVDKDTGVAFRPEQVVGETTFQCLGAGVRKVFIVKVYAAELCLEEGTLQPVVDYVANAQAKGGKPSDVAHRLEEDPMFFKTIVDSSGDKLMILHLVRDVSREELSKAFRESLSKVLPPDKVERLIAIIPGDGRKGEDVKLSSAGDRLTIDVGGQANQVDDAQIAQNIWWVWLGKDSVSPSLKKSIAEHLSGGI